jgi:hypothetical protein
LYEQNKYINHNSEIELHSNAYSEMDATIGCNDFLQFCISLCPSHAKIFAQEWE